MDSMKHPPTPLRDSLRLYLVTDPGLAGERGVYETVRQALNAGVRAVQLRDKEASTRSLIRQADAIREICAAAGAIFLVNDRVDVAAACKADGVHLGQDDMPLEEARRILGPDALIGVSVRTPGEMKEAEREGAAYAAANMVFATPTKTDLPGPLGIDALPALRSASASLPLVAIGGVHGGNAADVIHAGADGVAVVSAIMAAGDVAKACRDLRTAVSEGLGRKSR